jgi:hypothetical protein
VPAESYLERYPALRADLDAAGDLVYNEFLLREQLGETSDPTETRENVLKSRKSGEGWRLAKDRIR